MARLERCCVYLSLLAGLLLIGSTFGPLIRDRSIRQQTSEEDLNANIQSIYRKDFKAPSAVKEQASDQTDLVARTNPAGQREKRPIGNSDQQEMLFVVRDENGKLQPVFGSTTPNPTKPTPQYVQVVSTGPTKHEEILVLRASSADANGTSAEDPSKSAVAIDKDSYPPDYPFEKIRRILQARREMYREVFEEQLAVEALVTRIDSPTDQYLCSSTRSYKYPTYHPEAKANIVNVPEYYQRITVENCDNEGAQCSNAITDGGSKLICEQVYGAYDVYVVPLDNSTQFIRTQLRFPSCCKCRHDTA